MENKLRFTKRKFEKRAYRLLNFATKMERKVFYFLKRRRVDFIYQYPVHPYCIDFFFPKCNIVLEVDGITHSFQDRILEDEKRDIFLKERYGFKTIRITKVDHVTLCETLERIKAFFPKQEFCPTCNQSLPSQPNYDKPKIINVEVKIAPKYRHTGKEKITKCGHGNVRKWCCECRYRKGQFG